MEKVPGEPLVVGSEHTRTPRLPTDHAYPEARAYQLNMAESPEVSLRFYRPPTPAVGGGEQFVGCERPAVLSVGKGQFLDRFGRGQLRGPVGPAVRRGLDPVCPSYPAVSGVGEVDRVEGDLA
jgi:hypothetical protein